MSGADRQRINGFRRREQLPVRTLTQYRAEQRRLTFTGARILEVRPSIDILKRKALRDVSGADKNQNVIPPGEVVDQARPGTDYTGKTPFGVAEG